MYKRNYIKIDRFSLLYEQYAFVDTSEKSYLSVFADNGVKIKRSMVFVKPGTHLCLIVCMVKKKDVRQFEYLLETLRSKALIKGYPEYDELCEKLCDFYGE